MNFPSRKLDFVLLDTIPTLVLFIVLLLWTLPLFLTHLLLLLRLLARKASRRRSNTGTPSCLDTFSCTVLKVVEKPGGRVSSAIFSTICRQLTLASINEKTGSHSTRKKLLLLDREVGRNPLIALPLYQMGVGILITACMVFFRYIPVTLSNICLSVTSDFRSLHCFVEESNDPVDCTAWTSGVRNDSVVCYSLTGEFGLAAAASVPIAKFGGHIVAFIVRLGQWWLSRPPDQSRHSWCVCLETICFGSKNKTIFYALFVCVYWAVLNTLVIAVVVWWSSTREGAVSPILSGQLIIRSAQIPLVFLVTFNIIFLSCSLQSHLKQPLHVDYNVTVPGDTVSASEHSSHSTHAPHTSNTVTFSESPV